ncbi:MAG: hypothetical protein K9J06_01225 [Flavobacteriales bacterium]|nr:hypothetical protein [Flavobacteriales bacterium]
MRTNNFIRTIVLAITMLVSTAVHAQMSDHRFNLLFAQAFEDVMAGDHCLAQPVLEQLHRSRPQNAHVNYLLGLALMKQGRDADRAAQLLLLASARFDPRHGHGRSEDESAPGSVFFLLGDALAMTGRHAEAVNAYRTYMTTISLASIQRKSEVIQRIRDAREAMAAADTNNHGLLAQLTTDAK